MFIRFGMIAKIAYMDNNQQCFQLIIMNGVLILVP